IVGVGRVMRKMNGCPLGIPTRLRAHLFTIPSREAGSAPHPSNLLPEKAPALFPTPALVVIYEL
ncbi:MAG: hypothetical protein IJ766_01745, partial [Clostridia bacterium]|nr:hypothetical protein [Clostridia bacterium]